MVLPILAFAGLTILFRTVVRPGQPAGRGDADRLEWYLAEARAYYERPGG